MVAAVAVVPAPRSRTILYLAHGLTIRSDLPLPELISTGSETRTVDVEIRLAPVPEAGSNTSEDLGIYKGPTGSCIYSSPGGRFRIKEGREIVVDPAPGVGDEELHSFLLGPTMAILLHQRGLLVLHASAVAIHGSAVGILGEPGQGKSTLVAELHRRGHVVVTDDLMAIETETDPFTISPGFPQIRLWPDTIAFLGEAPEDLRPVGPCLEKRVREVRNGFPDSPLPLRRIYLLDQGGPREIAPLRPSEACIELVRHTYPAARLDTDDTATRHFRQCAAVAKNVGVSRLYRPAGLTAMSALAEAVEEDLPRSERMGRNGRPIM